MEQCATHGECISALKEATADIQENIRELAKGQHVIRERLARGERDIEMMTRVVRDQEAHTQAITKMSIAIEHLAEQVKDAIILIKDVDGRVITLEKIPNSEILERIEGVKSRLETLERAPGEEMVALAKQAKRETVKLAVAAGASAIVTAISILAYVAATMGGVYP